MRFFFYVVLSYSPKQDIKVNTTNVAELPWKPAVHCGWPADHVEVVGFVDSQSFVDVTVRVDVCSHGTVERQAAERDEDIWRMSAAVTPINTSAKNKNHNGPWI